MIAFVMYAQMASSPLRPFPGLYDVRTEDGREYRDLTKPQVEALAARCGWTLKPGMWERG